MGHGGRIDVSMSVRRRLYLCRSAGGRYLDVLAVTRTCVRGAPTKSKAKANTNSGLASGG